MITSKSRNGACEASATTIIGAVTGACCAGDDCGSCHVVIEDMIEARWGKRPGTVRRLDIVRAA